MNRCFLTGIISGMIILTLTGFQEEEGGTGVPVSDSVYFFKGRILDEGTLLPVAFTHVLNAGRNTATICDTLGYFFLRVNLDDTLYFRSIGYAHLPVVFNDSLRRNDRIHEILLSRVSYSIRGVMINPLGSYQSFRHRVINMELPPPDYQINPTVLMDIEQGTDTLDFMPAPAMSPITALYNWLSKEGKELRKLRRIIEQQQFERDISYKYSPLIVSGITGYAGYELYSFIDFCSFKKKFLQNADRYEIRDAIVEKQAAFEAMKEE